MKASPGLPGTEERMWGHSCLLQSRALSLCSGRRAEVCAGTLHMAQGSHTCTEAAGEVSCPDVPAWPPARATCPGWHRAKLQLLWPSVSNTMLRLDEKSTDNCIDNNMSKITPWRINLPHFSHRKQKFQVSRENKQKKKKQLCGCSKYAKTSLQSYLENCEKNTQTCLGRLFFWVLGFFLISCLSIPVTEIVISA